LKENEMRPEIEQYMWWALAAVALTAVLFHPELAHASAGAGGGLPYESAMSKLVNSAKGPYAFSASVLGIVAAGGSLIFGGDISGFFRTFSVIVLVIGMLVGATNVLQTLFATGAVICDQHPTTIPLLTAG
jgi:type IV secretion system protein VirB2